jgi:hypothetical protein
LPGGSRGLGDVYKRQIHFLALLAPRSVFPAIRPFLQPSPVGWAIFW